jgi:5-hydroxyisourate hydrolase
VITTHVLDTARGKPATGVSVRLDRVQAGTWLSIGSGLTDGDGRLRSLTPAGPVAPGTYRIAFDTGTYFAALSVEVFFPLVEIQFLIADGTAHYHVPLLLSPFGYSTYRGS